MENAGAGSVCFDAGLEGAGGRGARPPGSSARDENDSRAWDVGLRQGAKTGRRPLLGPSARLSRALSQKIGAPSMHTPGHTRGARPGTKKPGGPRRGVIVGRRASPIFYYPTGRRPNTKGGAPRGPPPIERDFVEPPRREVAGSRLPRARVGGPKSQRKSVPSLWAAPPEFQLAEV